MNNPDQTSAAPDETAHQVCRDSYYAFNIKCTGSDGLNFTSGVIERSEEHRFRVKFFIAFYRNRNFFYAFFTGAASLRNPHHENKI